MKGFLELLKLPPTLLSAVALFTGAILFLPQSILSKMGLVNLPSLWRTIIGIAFLIAISVDAVYLIVILAKKLQAALWKSKLKREFPKMMSKLRDEELFVLAMLYNSPNYTSRLPVSDGVTLRLSTKAMIQLTSSTNITYGDDMRVPYTITPIAHDYLDNHPEMIKRYKKGRLQNLYNEYNDYSIFK